VRKYNHKRIYALTILGKTDDNRNIDSSHLWDNGSDGRGQRKPS
jgi:hypothetical protein